MADEEVVSGEAGQPKGDEFGINQKRMPFTAHLVELRWRILICVAVLAVLFLVFFVGFSERLFGWMTLPVRQAYYRTGGEAKYHFKYEEMLQALTPMAMFVSAAYFCFVGALVVAAPVIVYEFWAFVAPGLKRKERLAVTKVVGSGSLLFFLGAAFAYFVALPVMLGFFLDYTARFGVTSRWNIADVIDFETMIILVFGLCFEMPLVVVALAFLGILPPAILAKKRRHAIVVIFVLAGIITPTPDPFSQICLAVPLVILYEIGYQVAKRVKGRGTLWDRWYGPVEPETPSTEPSGEGAPAYTEGSSYLPDTASQSDVAPWDGQPPAEPPPPGTHPVGESEPTPPDQPSPPEAGQEPAGQPPAEEPEPPQSPRDDAGGTGNDVEPMH